MIGILLLSQGIRRSFSICGKGSNIGGIKKESGKNLEVQTSVSPKHPTSGGISNATWSTQPLGHLLPGVSCPGSEGFWMSLHSVTLQQFSVWVNYSEVS